MERRQALMLGNRIKGISKLLKEGKPDLAADQVDRLHLNIDPVVLTQYARAVEAAKKYYALADTEMLDLVGQGVIDSLLGDNNL